MLSGLFVRTIRPYRRRADGAVTLLHQALWRGARIAAASLMTFDEMARAGGGRYAPAGEAAGAKTVSSKLRLLASQVDGLGAEVEHGDDRRALIARSIEALAHLIVELALLAPDPRRRPAA